MQTALTAATKDFVGSNNQTNTGEFFGVSFKTWEASGRLIFYEKCMGNW
jgi:hypothetical protein